MDENDLWCNYSGMPSPMSYIRCDECDEILYECKCKEKRMNKEQQELLDEVYENYLNNFIEPVCPPNLDVQPSYYEPMTKEWFVKSAKEKGLRGDEFSEKWGLRIEERDLSKDERIDLYCEEYTNGVKGKYEPPFDDFIDAKLTTRDIPTRLITITYNDKTIESYEN
jgi:hypothetical protein